MLTRSCYQSLADVLIGAALEKGLWNSRNRSAWSRSSQPDHTERQSAMHEAHRKCLFQPCLDDKLSSQENVFPLKDGRGEIKCGCVLFVDVCWCLWMNVCGNHPRLDQKEEFKCVSVQSFRPFPFLSFAGRYSYRTHPAKNYWSLRSEVRTQPASVNHSTLAGCVYR